MERGLYAAATGMLAQQAIQDVLAQNIANANTVGYKQDSASFQALHGMMLQRRVDNSPQAQIGEIGTGVAPGQAYTDWQAGTLSRTGAPLDAALGGNQFFAVQTPAGERYTRAGNFQLDGQGNLLTATGSPVLDINNRPINTGRRTRIAFDNRGNLTAGGQPIARLKIVQIDPRLLVKQGSTQFSVTSPLAVKPVALPQFYSETLEQSNVNTVQSMVRLITVTRGFDMAQKAILTQDELLKQATTEIGKV